MQSGTRECPAAIAAKWDSLQQFISRARAFACEGVIQRLRLANPCALRLPTTVAKQELEKMSHDFDF